MIRFGDISVLRYYKVRQTRRQSKLRLQVPIYVAEAGMLVDIWPIFLLIGLQRLGSSSFFAL